MKEFLNRPQLRKVQLENIEGCDNVHLKESTFNEFLENALKDTYQIDKEKVMKEMLYLLKNVLKENDIQPEIDAQIVLQNKIELQISTLVDK